MGRKHRPRMNSRANSASPLKRTEDRQIRYFNPFQLRSCIDRDIRLGIDPKVDWGVVGLVQDLSFNGFLR
jgi:hypothetical protein